MVIFPQVRSSRHECITTTFAGMKRFGALSSFIFFGNYFYGVCAVALSVEAALQMGYPLADAWYYVSIFIATVLYYTKAYIDEDVRDPENARAVWYASFYKTVVRTQLFFTVVLGMLAILFLKEYWHNIWKMSMLQWGLLLAFPVVAGLYYGISSPRLRRYNLRNIGWLKPFVIGFTWAGLVSVYPIVYYTIVHGVPLEVTLIGVLLFVKNLMYITILCIMFDIKDYNTDQNRQLKTFVVKAGLRRTIFSIMIPLSVIGLGCFLAYGFTHGFSTMKIVLNTIPFVLLIIVAYSMKRPKSLFFYLVLIDGLMLVKACCGIIAMKYF
jgi:hypothetical protein